MLLALLDLNYRFIFVDTGCNGRASDGEVFSGTPLAICLREKSLSLFCLALLLGHKNSVSYAIVANDAFPFQHNMKKPYPHRSKDMIDLVFYYRLCCFRGMVESIFEIEITRFRVLLQPIH